MFDYQRSEAQDQRRRLFHRLYQHCLITHSKRTPKPEEMFEPIIRKGLGYIKRRPFKPPLLVFK